MSTSIRLRSLTNQLLHRTASAIVSQLHPRSPVLRHELLSRLTSQPGEPASLLADLALEAGFGWTVSEATMESLVGDLLTENLVSAMDQVPQDFKEQRFPRTRFPYEHQLEAWRILAQDDPQSVLVASGTGSGKTECFVVPILASLARENLQRGPLTGVRALFLYPLNALINSQRDRLSAWLSGFAGDIRFCLYNGETPETMPARIQRGNPAQVLSRAELRRSPPPLLVTNPTMLEYMLVRHSDQPIIRASQGILSWVVIDEAHTYVGSAAAELALLIRRVYEAFDVEPNQVRFVATSATISGQTDEKSKEDLADFLAGISGVDRDHIHVIRGHRHVPDLGISADLVAESTEAEIRAICDDTTGQNRFETLMSVRPAIQFRERLAKGPTTLRELASATTLKVETTLDLLDACASSRRDAESFLPVRVHMFQRTLAGLWACLNGSCPGRPSAEDYRGWSFGAIFESRRDVCLHCESLVFEVVLCVECGQHYLDAQEVPDNRGGTLLQPGERVSRQFTLDEDDWLSDVAEEEPGEQSGCATFARLIAETNDAEFSVLKAIDPKTGHVEAMSPGRQSYSVVVTRGDGALVCTTCGRSEKVTGSVFRPLRTGADFHLSVAVPTLLEHTPPAESGRSWRPFHGRRLITFTDSRQGTARFAARAQLEAERNHVRGVLYHHVRSQATSQADSQDSSLLDKEIKALEGPSQNNPIIARILEDKRKQLELSEKTPVRSISWNEAISGLRGDHAIREVLPSLWRDVTFGAVDPEHVPTLCLLREFARRPKRQNSLETLGLVGVRYPGINRLTSHDLPAVCLAEGLSLSDWNDLLTVLIDHTVRGRSATQVPRDFHRWMGVPIRPRYLIGPGTDVSDNRRQVRWPSLLNTTREPQAARLIARGLDFDLDNPRHRSTVDELLNAAWDVIRQNDGLTEFADGYQLDYQGIEFICVQDAWLCPITNRVLARTFRGFTPYAPADAPRSSSVCQPIRMPELEHPYWRDDSGNEIPWGDRQEWIDSCSQISNLRSQGVWAELSDRIVALVPFFRVVEHSAQQDSARLRSFEQEFKEGKINLLSCSTTMEMGVDIGGLSAIGMNNPPPSPANFLQRAGRAGRRGEGVAVSLSLCTSTPHGQAIFDNPLWLLTSPIHPPRVSLQSEKIVRRHVNSLALRLFFVTSSIADSQKLSAGWFFEFEPGSVTPSDRFSAWCRNEAPGEPRVAAAITALVRGTRLAGQDAVRLLSASAAEIEWISSIWRTERDTLEDQLREFESSKESEKSPGVLAVKRTLERSRGEFLLGFLAAHSFLPGYGFPTTVVPFIPTTLSQLRYERESAPPRDDLPTRRRSYPSRELAMALREYAPGSDIVLDGRVYKSEGITLNWKIPHNDHEVHEIQSMVWAWRCRSCGSSGSSRHLCDICPACGDEDGDLEQHEFLVPSGFAVGLTQRPHNDPSARTTVPFESPWMTASGSPWLPLALASIGRYRYSPSGHVFHYSRGQQGEGFAVCLRCGRAASESDAGPDTLPREMVEHRRLRGGVDRDGDSRCPGNDSPWAIKRGLWLGVTSETDIFELQLRDPSTGAAVTKSAGYTIGIALRFALCQFLGIDEREVGCAISPSRDHGGGRCVSVLLHDTAQGGAGYVASIADNIGKLLADARAHLDCGSECDRFCHTCVLTWDSRHRTNLLDRHEALGFLDSSVLSFVTASAESRLLGTTSQIEQQALWEAVRRESGRTEPSEAVFFLGGDAASWEIAEWNGRPRLIELRAGGCSVTVCVQSETLAGLDAPTRADLGSLVNGLGVQLATVDHQPGTKEGGAIVAQLRFPERVTTWAVPKSNLGVPDCNWPTGDGEALLVRSSHYPNIAILPENFVDADQLHLRPEGSVEEIRISDEVDGPIEGFGERFWATLEERSQLIGNLLREGVKSIEYTDRFVRSPLIARLLYEVCKALSARQETGTRIAARILTSYPRRNLPQPNAMDHDWTDARTASSVMKTTLSKAGVEARINHETYRKVPHYRELRLHRANGDVVWIRLDQGFGSWRTRETVSFPFEARESVQSDSLLSAQATLVSANAAVNTIMYVGTRNNE